LRAARALLAEQGTSRVTLRMVAERAGVRAPLVHYYFGSKAELFSAVIEEVAGALRDRLIDIAGAGETPAERLREFVAGIIRAMASDPFTPRLMAELVIFPDDERTDRFVSDFGAPNVAAFRRVLQDGIDANEFRPLPPEFVAPVLLGACIFYFLGAPALRRILDFEPLDSESVERYAACVGDLLLNGLGAKSTGRR